jgi:hypothetical protein
MTKIETAPKTYETPKIEVLKTSEIIENLGPAISISGWSEYGGE